MVQHTLNTALKQETMDVKGMHCASCSAIISKKLSKLPGIQSCEINIVTEKAKIEYNPDQISLPDINNQLNPLGYALTEESKQIDAPLQQDHAQHMGLTTSKAVKLQEVQALREKVEWALPVSILIFLLMIWDIAAQLLNAVPMMPIPMGLFNTISFVIASVTLFWIGKPYITAVLRLIQYRVANMDSLVGIGTLSAVPLQQCYLAGSSSTSIFYFSRIHLL